MIAHNVRKFLCRLMGRTTLTCAAIATALLLSAPIFAADAPPVSRVPGEKRGLDTLISVNLPEMDLAQAVRMLAEEAGVNITLGKNVEGTVTCSLRNVTARVALEAFLRSNGYDFIAADGVLVVIKPGQPGAYGPAKATSVGDRKIRRKVFRLPYTGAETDSVASAMASSYTPAATVDLKTVKKIDETIREMLSPMGRMAYYERQHMLIVEDDEDHIAGIEEFVKELWAVPFQCFIDSKLLEVSLEKGEDLGLRWTTLSKISGHGKTNQLYGSDPATDTLGTALVSSAPSLGLDKFFSLGVVNANIEIVLEALGMDRCVELRSNPRVLVMNHRTATIVVGQEIPYLSSIESTGGTSPIRTYAFKEVAVRLEVTPHIAEDGMIFMDVHPVVKSVIGYTDEPRQPILSTREAATNVSVRDGSTLIIGGLVQCNVTRTRTHVPYISKIPLVGLLFRQKSDQQVKNDLLFLLCPKVVTPEMMDGMIKDNAHIIEAPEPCIEMSGSPTTALTKE